MQDETKQVALLADDDAGLRRLMGKVLRQRGYAILEAENGREALHILANPQTRVDVVVTDVVMPWLGGQELVDQIRASGRNVPVVCVSGFGADSEELGFAGTMLAKPFTSRQLIAAVEDALGSRA